MTEEKSAKARYMTTNWAAYNAALKARGSLTIWLNKDMQWYAPASCKRGRQRVFSDAAIEFCLSIKCLFGLPLRQTLGLVESLLQLANLDWRVPNYSTVCRRQKHLQVSLPCQRSSTALDLLVDSTGIKFFGEGEWKRKKHGAEYRRQWRKVHLAIDAKTLEIRAIEVTDNSIGDAPMLPEQLGQIPTDEAIASVSADGVSNTAELTLQEVLERYKSLADIERGFRVLKSEIEIGPVYHRLPQRIRAHAAICFMALILYRVMRAKLRAADTKLSPERALDKLRRIQLSLFGIKEPAVFCI